MLIPEDFEAISAYEKKLVYFVYLNKLRSSLNRPEKNTSRNSAMFSEQPSLHCFYIQV